MSNFDLTFCKVYIYAKGWPGINLGASHESCTHPIEYGTILFFKLSANRYDLGLLNEPLFIIIAQGATKL